MPALLYLEIEHLTVSCGRPERTLTLYRSVDESSSREYEHFTQHVTASQKEGTYLCTTSLGRSSRWSVGPSARKEQRRSAGLHRALWDSVPRRHRLYWVPH